MTKDTTRNSAMRAASSCSAGEPYIDWKPVEQ